MVETINKLKVDHFPLTLQGSSDICYRSYNIGHLKEN